jgi:type I restriction enzyme R subunit
MNLPKVTYHTTTDSPSSIVREDIIEYGFIGTLQKIKYDVILFINGVPCVQIESKTLGISPRRAMEQIFEYKHDPGNGYTKTLLCFLQLFIVSNRDRTYYFANNNSRHFTFNADERFLPVYEFADESNRKITHFEEFADAFLKKCYLGRTISRYMVLIASEQKPPTSGNQRKRHRCKTLN